MDWNDTPPITRNHDIFEDQYAQAKRIRLLERQVAELKSIVADLLTMHGVNADELATQVHNKAA